jgi:2,4-dienoyl-CoA reductase (NADPH2)
VEEYHRYLTTQLEKLHVEVRMNRFRPRGRKERPDVVIVATGATPLIPDLPGMKSNHVATAVDVLAGMKKTGEIVVVGWGSTGCETAEFLTQKGKQVTILEMLPRIGADYGPMNRWVVIDRLIAAGIRLKPA